MRITLPCPPPYKLSHAVFPVFLPFKGCIRRCIFCSQHAQSGTDDQPLPQLLAAAARDLRARQAQGLAPAELAFYGGTFTAMPADAVHACLHLARTLKAEGCICALRCSTKPDALSPDRLTALRDAGCTTVELGVQSFDDAALAQAQRGYDGATALDACRRVREAGVALGVQLMPGMPGVTPEVFARDVQLALDAGACCLRFYPCLVLKGTKLAELWQHGHFTPWTAEQGLPALARAWNAARAVNVPVIRMGLAPQPGLDAHILAGPAHPALGSAVQGLALYYQIKESLADVNARIVRKIYAPRHRQGVWWGHKGSLAPLWNDMYITSQNIVWTKESCINMEVDF